MRGSHKFCRRNTVQARYSLTFHLKAGLHPQRHLTNPSMGRREGSYILMPCTESCQGHVHAQTCVIMCITYETSVTAPHLLLHVQLFTGLPLLLATGTDATGWSRPSWADKQHPNTPLCSRHGSDVAAGSCRSVGHSHTVKWVTHHMRSLTWWEMSNGGSLQRVHLSTHTHMHLHMLYTCSRIPD